MGRAQQRLLLWLELAGRCGYQQPADPARPQDLGLPRHRQPWSLEVGHAGSVLSWECWRLSWLSVLLLFLASKKLLHHGISANAAFASCINLLVSGHGWLDWDGFVLD